MRLYQDAVRVEYRQGTYSVTVVTSVPWDTERVLRTLPCQVAARLSRRFSRSNLRILWRNDRLYSQIPRPFWRDLAGIVAIGSCSSAADPLVRFLEPIVVQFHCVIEIDFSSGEKRLFPICVFIKTQYSFRISGNRDYDSNRVRFYYIFDQIHVDFFQNVNKSYQPQTSELLYFLKVRKNSAYHFVFIRTSRI